MAGVALQIAYVRIGVSTESDLVITDAQVIDFTEELDIITDEEIDN